MAIERLYNVKARLMKGKKKTTHINDIDLQEIINDNFPLCIQAENINDVREKVDVICDDIHPAIKRNLVFMIERE